MGSRKDWIEAVRADQKWNHIRIRLSSSDPALIGCSYGRIHNVMRELNLLPDILPTEEKSNRLSEELRNQGNIAFTKTKDNKAAIKLYTKAICAALPNSKEIALAYGNRSAVTYDIGLEFMEQTEGRYVLKGFKDSIKDIDRALATDSFPDHLKYKLYKRRGESLMYQGEHSEALNDLKLAQTHIQRYGLAQDKIESSLSKIDFLMDPSCPCTPPDAIPYLPTDITLSCEPSPYIDCASSAVDITYFPRMGRGVVTNRDVLPGDVLAIEKRYASALFPDFFLEHCDNCTERCLSPIPCTSCRTLVYCSEKCRQSGWTSYHSMECRILPSLLAYFPAIGLNIDLVLEMQLALRLFLIASKSGEDLGKLLKEEPKPSDPSRSGFVDGKYLSDYSSVHHLVTNFEAYEDNFKVMFIGHAIALMRLLRRGTKFFEILDTSSIAKQSNQCCPSVLTPIHLTVANLLLKFRMIVQMNSVNVVDPRYDKVGIAIYPFFSLVNHSCDANVIKLHYAGDTIFAVAMQPIPKGQQVLRNYRVNFKVHPRSIRQQQLRRYYAFTCECIPCIEDWPVRIAWPEKPIFTRPYQADNILGTVKAVEKAFEFIRFGEGSVELMKFVAWFMGLVFESVKLPWEPYAKAQEAIELFRSFQAKPELTIIFLNEVEVLSREM